MDHPNVASSESKGDLGRASVLLVAIVAIKIAASTSASLNSSSSLP